MTTSSASWLSWLAAKKSELSEEGCKIDESICDEASFVSAFKKLCIEKKEIFPVQFINPLVFSCKKVFPFVEAIAEQIPGLSPSALKGLVWGATYSVIEASTLKHLLLLSLICSKYGTKDRSRLPTVVNVLVGLNNALISIAVDNGSYPYDLALQLPLQEFFGVYTDSYAYVVSIIKKHGQGMRCPRLVSSDTRALTSIGTSSNLMAQSSLDEYIGERNRKFEESKKKYQNQLIEENVKQERCRHEEGRGWGWQPLLQRRGSADHRDHNPLWVQAEFKLIDHIAGGRCSSVDKVQNISTKEYFACKTIYFSQASSEAEIADLEKKAKEEVKIMRKLTHEHIVSVILHVERKDRISILMTPIADKDLRQYLNECTSHLFPIAMVNPIYRWFGSLLHALDHAHLRKIRHRDIKPANILIEGGKPYLADFGLALDFTKQETSSTHSLYVQGTPVYFAPESSPGGDHGPPADVFALGCVFSEMLTVANKRSLEDYQNFRYTKEDSIYGHYAFHKQLPQVRSWINGFSKGDRNELLVFTIQGMIQEDIGKRLTARKALETLMSDTGLFIHNDCLRVSTNSTD